MALKHDWIDWKREPKADPNPDFPDGLDVNHVDDPAAPSCRTDLPYPARRCGFYLVRCDTCGLAVIVTTAGRPDDPRSFKTNCRPKDAIDAETQH